MSLVALLWCTFGLQTIGSCPSGLR